MFIRDTSLPSIFWFFVVHRVQITRDFGWIEKFRTAFFSNCDWMLMLAGAETVFLLGFVQPRIVFQPVRLPYVNPMDVHAKVTMVTEWNVMLPKSGWKFLVGSEFDKLRGNWKWIRLKVPELTANNTATNRGACLSSGSRIVCHLEYGLDSLQSWSS